MTRINCVPVEELSGKHLVAEYRELPRIYGLATAALARGETPADHPDRYALGQGHVRFFYSRMGFVIARHRQLIAEMKRRGYKPTFTAAPKLADWPRPWRRKWQPIPACMAINRARLRERGGTDYE